MSRRTGVNVKSGKEGHLIPSGNRREERDEQPLCFPLDFSFDRIGESHAGSSVSAVGEIRKDHVNPD